MSKNSVIIALLALVAMTGQAQAKCHIEGELRDTMQGSLLPLSAKALSALTITK